MAPSAKELHVRIVGLDPGEFGEVRRDLRPKLPQCVREQIGIQRGLLCRDQRLKHHIRALGAESNLAYGGADIRLALTALGLLRDDDLLLCVKRGERLSHGGGIARVVFKKSPHAQPFERGGFTCELVGFKHFDPLGQRFAEAARKLYLLGIYFQPHILP